MRILHIHSGNLYGGVETLLTTLASGSELWPRVETNVALCFEGRLSAELISTGAGVHHLGPVRISRPLSVLRTRAVLADLLQQGAFELAICHSAWSQAIFGRVVRSANLPLVRWLHGDIKRRDWLERWASRTTPDLILCNSKFTARTLLALYPEVRSEVVYCPVAPLVTADEIDRAATRSALQTPAASVVLIQVSRMEAWKGHVLHLEALAKLKDVPDWVCWQVGGAQRGEELEYLNRLQQTARGLGIADRVRFLGQCDDVPRLLAAADIYCQPNLAPEPFGISFVEALYANLPVVTTTLGGACEIVDETCGLLVPPGDTTALAASLRRLIEDPAWRAKLGAGGASRARKLCDPVTQVELLGRMLASVTRSPEIGSIAAQEATG